MYHYGTKIRKHRQAKGYSQDYMATQLSISQNAYSKIESDQTNVKANTLERIAEILGVDKMKLMAGDDANSYNIEQKNEYQASGVGVAFYQDNFEQERKLWQSLEKSLNGTIQAQAITINLLQKKVEEVEGK